MSDLTGRISSPGAVSGAIIGSGPPGPPGNTPYIGTNGNWWIGDVDTGVPAGSSVYLEPITNAEMEELLK